MKTKMKLIGLFCLSLLVFLTAFFAIKNSLFAVASNVTVTSLVTSSTTIKEDSLTPVFKITFGNVETNEVLQSVSVALNSSASADVSAITSNVLEDNRIFDGGWQLWKDSNSGTSGTFERYTDEQLILDADNLTYDANGAFTLNLDTNETLTNEDIFYVAIKTDDTGLPYSTSFSTSLTNITTSGTTQPTITTTSTSTLSLTATPKCVKVELLDGALSQGDRIRMIFNQSMDFSYLDSYGLSWYIYQYDSSWNQLSFGTSPTLSYSNNGGANNDTITITLGSSPTITTSRTFYYSLPSASTSYYWAYGQKRFDLTAPTLQKIELISDINSDGEANDIGDKLAFQFSENINRNIILPNNVDSMLVLSSSASYGSATPDLNWWGSSTLVMTLNENLETNLIGKTVTGSNSIKDVANNAINSSSPPTIQISTIAPIATVRLYDDDTSNSWISKYDISVDYTLPAYNSSIRTDTDFHVDIYLVPENIGFSSSALYKINSANLTDTIANTTYTFDGTDSDYSLWYDSRTNYVSIANNDWSNVEYYSIEENTRYIAYAVTCTAAHSSETISDCSMPRASEPTSFTAESWSETTSQPWVTKYSPNSSSVARNTKTFSMTFSEALDSTTVEDIDNYSLKYDSDANWTYDTQTALTGVSYDSETYTIYVTTDQTLAASKWYYLQVDDNVTDLYNTSVGSYAGMYFQTGSSSDSTAPTVSSANISNGAINVSPSLSSISIVFSEGMDATTMSTGATLEPNVSDISIVYDVSSNALKYAFGRQNMLENTAYTFTLDGSIITDSTGNYLDGDSNSSAGGDYSISFTTGILDTTKPQIDWSTFDGYNLYIGFDKEMKEGDVEDYANWTLTCDDVSQTLSWSTFTYDEYNYELTITGLYCSSGADYTITAANSVRGGNNQVIDSDYDTSSGTVESATTNGGSVVGGDTYSSTYSSVYTWPTDNAAGETTSYYISFPINKSLENEGKITVEWPSGFDISTVSLKSVCDGSSYSNCSWNNSDINGTWNGIYDSDGGTLYDGGAITISNISNDTIQNKTTLTLCLDYDEDNDCDSGAVTKSSDYIYFDLTGVVNSTTASTVDWYSNTGGYTINVSTRTSSNAKRDKVFT